MCDGPILVMKAGATKKDGSINPTNVFAACGRCPLCKLKRINDWVFRLLKEDQTTIGNYFVTLTYNTDNVPITKNKYMSLRKSDFQKFMKRLRKRIPPVWSEPDKNGIITNLSPVKYYAAGEYGDKSFRPHYHAILFNIPEERFIFEAWLNPETKEPIGDVHIGQVTGESIAYTAKYIDKDKRIPLHKNDDRLKEFSLMSKGLGSSYIAAASQYHQEDYLNNVHYTAKGIKRFLPRYFRQKLFTEEQQQEQNLELQSRYDTEYMKREAEYYHSELYKKNPISFENYLNHEKAGRIERQKAKQNKRNTI